MKTRRKTCSAHDTCISRYNDEGVGQLVYTFWVCNLVSIHLLFKTKEGIYIGKVEKRQSRFSLQVIFKFNFSFR